jgi:hypothetical protein
MTATTYAAVRTALLIVNPYNDFFWGRRHQRA